MGDKLGREVGFSRKAQGLAFVLAEPGKDDGSCVLALLGFLG